MIGLPIGARRIWATIPESRVNVELGIRLYLIGDDTFCFRGF